MKCGHICIAGPPNAGKSTLMNHIMGEKMSVVTHKAQTTRVSVECILTRGDCQAVFLDTPGLLSPKGSLQRSMEKEARRAIAMADVKALILDASTNPEGHVHLVNLFQILVLNKVDLVKDKKKLLESTRNLTQNGKVKKVFMVSALKGSGVNDLLLEILEQLPERDWLYQKDKKTKLTPKLQAAELTRETIFLHVHQEIPYNLWVKTTSWQEKANGIHIHQVIYVGKESHKSILVGAKGSKISTVGEISRKKMQRTYKQEVHLFLRVKVDKEWQDKGAYYHSWAVKKP